MAVIALHSEGPSTERQLSVFGTRELRFTELSCLELDVLAPNEFAISSQFQSSDGSFSRRLLFSESSGLGLNNWKRLAFEFLPPAPGPFNIVMHAMSSTISSAALAVDNFIISPFSCLSMGMLHFHLIKVDTNIATMWSPLLFNEIICIFWYIS